MISKTMQCVLCDIIWIQCFTPLTHIFINTNFTLLDSSPSTSSMKMDTSDMTAKSSLSATNMDITCETMEHSSKTTDTTSGK